MEYVEKELPVEQIEEPTDPLNLEEIAKFPISLIENFLKENIEKIREGMGGDCKDITSRPITSEDKIISGFENDLRIRIYRPENTIKRPLMVFFHGGGWFGGSLESVEEYCKGVCDQADCLVISVDYHLVPEHPYPEGVEDCYLAIKWAVMNKSALNIDENKIVVSGDSAGGNISAVLSLMANDRKEFKISKQILIYPATNLDIHANESSPGVDKFLQAIINLYLQGKVDSSDPYVSPAFAKNFNNLPDALIAVGEQDGLYKSSLEYAKILDKAGNKVKFILYKNTDHAFIDRIGNSNQADDLVKEAAEFIRN